jgi:hypothetical protein
MGFRHLDYPVNAEVTRLGPAALDALLERGDLDSWVPLLRVVAGDPFGPLADTILRISDAHPMYGTSTLWRDWIARRRGRPAPETTTLAEARTRAGLTQTQVAERMGIGQSDVSKLERRSDVRLSTLRAYAAAIGARLQVTIRGASDGAPRELAFPD